MFTTILPEGASQPIAPYAHATKAGNTVYVSGTLAIDPDGKSLHVGDMEAQTRYVIEQIKGALEAAGASLTGIMEPKSAGQLALIAACKWFNRYIYRQGTNK